MIAFVWQFDVKQERQDDFELFFGANGDWTALARRSRSYLGSSFLKELTGGQRYLLIEYWSEMLVYERHVQDFSDEIEALKAQRDSLVTSTVPLGIFSALDVPDRFGPTWSQRHVPAKPA